MKENNVLTNFDLFKSRRVHDLPKDLLIYESDDEIIYRDGLDEIYFVLREEDRHVDSSDPTWQSLYDKYSSIIKRKYGEWQLEWRKQDLEKLKVSIAKLEKELELV